MKISLDDKQVLMPFKQYQEELNRAAQLGRQEGYQKCFFTVDTIRKGHGKQINFGDEIADYEKETWKDVIKGYKKPPKEKVEKKKAKKIVKTKTTKTVTKKKRK